MMASVSLVLGGQDRTTWLAVDGGSLSADIYGRKSLRLTVHDRGRGYMPPLGASVLLRFGDRLAFRGYVWDVRSELMLSTPRVIRSEIECVPREHVAKRRLYVADFTDPSLAYVVEHMCSVGLSGEGITPADDVPARQIEGRFVVNYEPVADVLSRLCETYGYVWHIDAADKLHVGPPQRPSPALQIHEDACLSLSVEWTRDGYRNRQYVRTLAIPEGTVGDETHYLAPDPQFGWGNGIGLRATILDIETLTVNGQPRTWRAVQPVVEQPPASGYDFWYYVGGFALYWLDYEPIEDDVLRVVYEPGLAADWMTAGARYKTIARDARAEQLRLAALEGGSGIWEAIEEFPHGASVDAMVARADALLRCHAREAATVTLTTREWVEPGQIVRVVAPSFGLDDELTARAVTIRWRATAEPGVAEVQSEVECGGEDSPVSDPVGYLGKVVQMARQAGAAPSAQLAQTISTDNWVARVIDGADPLQTGSDLAANRYEVAIPPGMEVKLIEWTLRLKRPAASGSVSADVLVYRNGWQSLFGSARPSLAAGQGRAAGQAFSIATLARGEALRYDLIQAGSDAAGLELTLRGQLIATSGG